MNTHHNEIASDLGVPPIITFIISVFVMLATQIIPELDKAQQWHIPPIIMEISQLLAWWCVGGTFVIAALNYLKINVFKKKKK